tara:strand:- start:233 stop:1099 length:867 start_codon:yes stop_codon:yes gene_type:complete
MRLFVFGAGYSGKAIAARMAPEAKWAGGTTRSPEKFSELESAGLTPFVFDGESLSQELSAALAGVTHLVQSVRPDAHGDPVLALAGQKMAALMPNLEWVGYLSTVGVYGNHDGAWIDEDTPCEPLSERSRWRLEAENQWLEFSKKSAIPVAVLRLSGIYGPGRNTFEKIKNGTARRLVKPGQVFNRIHVADIAGATTHLAAKGLGGVWNVTDDKPAPPQDVVLYASQLMGVEPPPETPFETAELSPMARSFYGDNKRVSNQRLKASGYKFAFPDYETALGALLESEKL